MNFSARLVAFATVIVLLTVGLSSALVYVRATSELERSLGHELLGITRSTASLVDADLLDLVYVDGDGDVPFMDEFLLLREQLDRVRTLNELPASGNPIYIMRPLPDYERSGQLEFVVMPDPGDDGRYFVGNVYPAKPHLVQALAGRATSTGVYSDEEGSWISAAAPLRDSQGDIVAVVQVDRPVAFFYERVRSQAVAIVWVAVISIAAGIALAIGFSRQLIGPIRAIGESVRAFGEGELSRRVHVERQDEIGALARGFNEMADHLERERHALETARESAVEALQSKSELVSNMEAMNGVLAGLTRARDVDGAIAITMQALIEGYGWAYGCCWRLDDTDDALCFALDHGSIDADFRAANRRARLQRGTGLPGRAWASGEVVTAAGSASEGLVDRLTLCAREAGASSAVALPIRRGHAIECVLEFVTLDDQSVSIALQETLAGVARLLAETIERLHSEAEKSAVTAESALLDAVLRSVATAPSPNAVLDGLAHAISDAFDECGALAFAVDGAQPRPVATAGLALDAARAHAPVDRPWLEHCVTRGAAVETRLDSGDETGPAAEALRAAGVAGVYCVPLRAEGDVLGVIEVLRTSAEPLTESRKESLDNAARLAADAAAGLDATERRRRASAAAAEIMGLVARGDLRARMEGDLHGEYTALQSAINTSITNLRTMVRGIRDVAGAVSSGATRIRQQNEALQSQTDARTSDIAACSTGVAGLAETIRENAERCDHARSLASTARELAVRGSDVANEAAGRMGEVEATTHAISDVIGVIDGIAERTNLLSLNASIEAARAGEAGRGFAIVAREVEELAKRCAAAAREVRELVTRTVESVHGGVDSVRRSGGALDEIVHAISEANDSIGEIAKSSSAQTENVELVEGGMSQLEAATLRYAEVMQEVSDAIREMSERAAELDGQVDSFELDDGGRDARS